MITDFPASRIRVSNFKNGILGGGIHAHKGFVHQIQIGFLGQSTRQEYPLLLPSGKFGDGRIRHVEKAGLFHGLPGDLVIFFLEASEQILFGNAP